MTFDLLAAQPVVLITGISASGKSTVAQLLASRFSRGVHVKGDVYRRMVVSGAAPMSADPSDEAVRQLHLRYDLGARTACSFHEAGFSVVVQDIVLGDDLPRYVAGIGARPLAVVVLAPDPAVVAQREAGRAKSAYGEGMVGLASLDEALRERTPRLGLWLDSSAQSADETVDEIVARADEALVD